MFSTHMEWTTGGTCNVPVGLAPSDGLEIQIVEASEVLGQQEYASAVRPIGQSHQRIVPVAQRVGFLTAPASVVRPVGADGFCCLGHSRTHKLA